MGTYSNAPIDCARRACASGVAESARLRSLRATVAPFMVRTLERAIAAADADACDSAATLYALTHPRPANIWWR